MPGNQGPGLLGRTSEREVLDRLMVDARGGQSGVVIVRGEAGIGKTALLRYAARQACGFRVAQIAGVEAEMELPFAAVHQLCAPIDARLSALPEHQRNALSVALGLSSGDAPDRFLVALAVLSLLSAVAEERPLLCLVDDAQWLDAASDQVLGFVARRLLAESVAIVFAIREPSTRREFEALPSLRRRAATCSSTSSRCCSPLAATAWSAAARDQAVKRGQPAVRRAFVAHPSRTAATTSCGSWPGASSTSSTGRCGPPPATPRG
jgi:AAA ATPase domain